MSAKYSGDVCVKTGTYQDQQGNNKNRYLKLGSYFTDEQGRIGILLQSVPINMNPGKDGGTWLTLFPQNKDNQSKNIGRQNNQPNNQNDAGVPF